MDPTGARPSWGSMLRTCRAAIAVLLVGDVALTIPPETHDMLTFLDHDRVGAAFSFQLALAVLGGSAWFWSRAALSARFGLGDMQRNWMKGDPRFDWAAFTWLPRVVLLVAFLAGMVIAAMGDSYLTVAGSVALSVLALAFTIFRPRTEGSAHHRLRASGSRYGSGTAGCNGCPRCYGERRLAIGPRGSCWHWVCCRWRLGCSKRLLSRCMCRLCWRLRFPVRR
jgi:hypothetical protein